MMESIAIDYRCRTCSMIRRVDALPGDTVAGRLPDGWVSHERSVVCIRCAPDGRDTRHERAEGRREAMKDLRPPALVYDTAAPVTDAPSPLAADHCHRCGTSIGEMESWRPDPTVTTYFAKAHRRCL